MKILFINVDSGYGGSTGRIVNDLYREAVVAGHEALILYGREFDPNAGVRAIKITSRANVYIHAALSRLTDRTGFYSRRATERAIREIAAFDPDVIHLHNLHGYYINIKILFRYLCACGKPVVWTLHDCWAFTGHCSHYSAAGCERWLTGCHHCPQKKTYPKSALADASQRNYRDKKALFCGLPNLTIVTPSAWLRDEVKKSFLGGYNTRVIYNGIDLATFCPTESALRESAGLNGKFVILGVANVWSGRKGYSDFLALAEKMEEDFRIVMIGLSDEQMQRLPKNCIGIRRTANQSELAAWYSMADVYFNASCEETMGLTTLEALACGTGVITYDKTAVPEVADKNCGIVIPCGDIAAVYGAICEIKEGRRTLSGMRDRALQFERTAQCRKYIDLYGEVCHD